MLDKLLYCIVLNTKFYCPFTSLSRLLLWREHWSQSSSLLCFIIGATLLVNTGNSAAVQLVTALGVQARALSQLSGAAAASLPVGPIPWCSGNWTDAGTQRASRRRHHVATLSAPQADLRCWWRQGLQGTRPLGSRPWQRTPSPARRQRRARHGQMRGGAYDATWLLLMQLLRLISS